MSKASKKFGSVSLEINDASGVDHDAFVPRDNKYVDQKKMLETIAYGIQEDMPVLLIGETGTGKTSAVRYIAQETNNAFRRLNLNGATTVDEFVGKILIDEKGTYWVDGILTDAMRKGHWLLIDEINAGLPEVLFVLQSLMDDDRCIVLSDKKDREIVRPHPNFRLFATCNPSDNYSGTKEMNKALLSRFPIVLEVGFPEADKELDIMKSKFKSINEDLASRMIIFANQQRESYKNHKVDFCLSTRELINWYRVQQFTGGNVRLAAKYTILGKCNQEDKDVFETTINIAFKEIEKEYDGPFKVGAEFIVTDDVVPFQTKNVVPKGSVLKVTAQPVDRGGLQGVVVAVSAVKYAPHDTTTIKVPIRPQFGLRVSDIEGKIQVVKEGNNSAVADSSNYTSAKRKA